MSHHHSLAGGDIPIPPPCTSLGHSLSFLTLAFPTNSSSFHKILVNATFPFSHLPHHAHIHFGPNAISAFYSGVKAFSSTCLHWEELLKGKNCG